MKYYFRLIREGTDFVQTIGPFATPAQALRAREAFRGYGGTVSQIASSED